MTTVATPTTAERIAELRKQSWVGPRLAHEVTLPGQPGDYRPWPERLHPELVAALRPQGLERAYSHQAEAIELALAGRDGPEAFRGDAGLDHLGIAGKDRDVLRHFGVVIRISIARLR